MYLNDTIKTCEKRPLNKLIFNIDITLMRILEILTKDEQADFDSPPSLDIIEQKKYFALSAEIEEWLKTVSSPTHMVGFVLLMGYACCSSKFFSPKTFKQSDISFICEKLCLDPKDIDFTAYNPRTVTYHKQKIREHLHILPFDNLALQTFEEIIREKIAKSQSFKQIIYEVAEILKSRKIEVPTYNRFATVISNESSKFESNLTATIDLLLSDAQRETLDALLSQDEINNYVLTKLKIINQERTPAAINNSVRDFQLIKNVYLAIAPTIISLALHVDTVKQYATWVRKASSYQIQQLNNSKRYLYMICFINHQYCLRQDISADILLISVRNTENAVSKEQKSLAHQCNALYEHAFNAMSNSRTSYKEIIKQIESVIKTAIPDAEKVLKINQLLSCYREQLENDPHDDEIKGNLNELQSKNYYSLLSEASQKLQNRVANIMRYISFEENNTAIYKAIAHYQTKGGNITKTAPANFMSTAEQEALEDDNGKFSVSLYKALLYIHAANALKSGIISLKPSYRYLSLESYLYPIEKWLKHKVNLLEDAELSQFSDISQLLLQLQQILDQQFKLTNKNIIAGKNEYVKFDAKNKVVINTPKVEKLDMKSIASLFAGCKYTPILKVLNDIQQVTDYLSCLRHFSVKDKQVLPDIQVFYAAILGLGCNIGISKIANVSRGISEDVLQNLVNWHISLDNVHLANRVVLEFLSKLSIAHIYKKDPTRLHSSSDGRKIGVSVESLNANSSFKYFGKGMGITNYSFIDELNRSFYATAIHADQEHTHVIDGLTHNPAIKSDIHSTDTHGYSEVIFAVMYLLGIDFAPRIKGLKHATLYAFIARKIYEEQGFKILPDRYIDTKIIEAQWDNILRLVATIKLHETTASQIFKRLNSYSKQHPLYCALKEFGRIIKTIFILRYINDVELRQSIQKQLNRIELSNKFANAISFDNDHEIQFGSKEEQDFAINCQRLIQNIIVLWNELYLSDKIASAETKEAKQLLISIILNGSTQSWGHFNFLGEYDFTNNEPVEITFDLKKIMELKI